ASSIGALPTVSLALSATSTETATQTRTLLPTDTPTLTTTPTFTATNTATPTPTSTLATLVLKLTAVNPDVTLQPVSIAANPTSVRTTGRKLDVPPPPVKLAPIPLDDTPVIGWYEYAVQDPRIQYEGNWALFEKSWHSINHRYYYSNDPKARLTLYFLGAAV